VVVLQPYIGTYVVLLGLVSLVYGNGVSSSSLNGSIVRYPRPDPPTRDGVLVKGSLVGRAGTHLILRPVNTVADLGVRDIRSHSSHCSAVVDAQESP
jgi:hypothetical protein